VRQISWNVERHYSRSQQKLIMKNQIRNPGEPRAVKVHYRILGAKGWYSDYIWTYQAAVEELAERLRLQEGNLRVKLNGELLKDRALMSIFLDAYLHNVRLDLRRRFGLQ
jgi:hypothetical protein